MLWSIRKPLIVLTAVPAWLSLGVILLVTDERVGAAGRTTLEALLAYFSYFTVLSNILATSCLSMSLVRAGSKTALVRPTIQSAAMVYLVASGLAYLLFLRGFWNPRGEIQVAADAMLHGGVPLLYIFYWLMFVPKGMLQWVHSLRWLVFPAGYVVAVLWLGALTGSYPYPTFDVDARGYGRVLTNASVFLTVVLAFGLVAVAIDRWMTRKNPQTSS